MKWFLCALLLPAVLTAGCAHNPYAATPAAPAASPLSEGSLWRPARSGPYPIPEPSVKPGKEHLNDLKAGIQEKAAAPSPPQESSQSVEIPAISADTLDSNLEVLDYVEEEGEEPMAGIADPLEPFNRAMYHFNDRLYFWVLKPLAQGYRTVVPEIVRIGVGNLFANSTFPSVLSTACSRQTSQAPHRNSAAS